MQENIGFTVKPVEAVDQIPTVFTFEKTTPRWRIGHLLLFLDSYDDFLGNIFFNNIGTKPPANVANV
jgi:hypothetical protein